MRFAFASALLALAACSGAEDPSDDNNADDTDQTDDSDDPSDDTDEPADETDDTDDMTVDAPPAALNLLVINEVAPGETPDWFEVVNVSGAALDLSLFSYCDVPDDFTKAKPFPAMSLLAGDRFAQDVDDTISGFKLGGDEALYVYRISDSALVDSVDWDEGAAPTGMSYARIPDTTGDFVMGSTQSKGEAND
jgi:hypothetical protein